MPVPMRAPGEGPGSFALESAMDELAYELGLDPLELRRRNHADRDQHADRPWSSNSLPRCYDRAAESFGWANRAPEPRSMTRDGRRIGCGMATAFYPSFWAPAVASVEIDRDGVLLVASGTQDIGTGTATIMAQLASDRLGWPRDRVCPLWGDTALPQGPPSVGSMASASIAPAVVDAADRLRAILRARQLANAALKAIAEAVRAAPAGTFRAISDRAEHPPGEDRSANAWGAVFAEVAVDEAVARMRVTRLHAAYAAGRLLNRRTALAQYQGGLVFGIGMACLEETVTDPRNGAIVNANLGEYLVPVAADVPELTVHMIDEDDPVAERFGVKGVGMIGTVGTAAAIANALFHALGKRIRDLPIRLEELL